jgi:hypothetical protein
MADPAQILTIYDGSGAGRLHLSRWQRLDSPPGYQILRARGSNLPTPAIIAAEIADDLEAALEQFTKIAARLAPAGARELEAAE